MRRAWIWWLAVLVPLWIAFALCAHWEPVLRDGWGHVDWHRTHAISVGGLWDEMVWGWRYNNPRPGQLLALASYTPGPWHVLFTPPALIALFAILAALVLGRWPAPRRLDDLLLFVMIVALCGACAAQFGPMLFYRPITSNYTHTLTIALAWLLPYRFACERPTTPRLWLAPLMLAFGFIAGFCNEHTGVAFTALALAATIVVWRRDGARIWMIAGIVGFLAGYALLLLAPGQSQRYEMLGAKSSIVERIVERGIGQNLWELAKPLFAMWPAIPAVALGLLAKARLPREQRRLLVALAIAGCVTALTVLASPKIGHRLFFASVTLWCSALAGWVTACVAGRLRTVAAALAGATLAFVLAMLVITYREVGPVGEARLAAISESAPGSTVYIHTYPGGHGHWFLGEDFDSAEFRDALAAEYRLKEIVLEP